MALLFCMIYVVFCADINCFDDELPLVFGTENADTSITVIDQWDDASTGLLFFVGGSTFDLELTENSAAPQKRAWVAQ